MTRSLPLLFIGLATLSAAFGQSDLQVSAVYGSAVQNISSGGSLSVTASNVGQAVLVNFNVLYTGSTTAIIQNLALTGTSEMAILSEPSLPVALAPNASIGFTVRYLPSTGNVVSGQISIVYSENGPFVNYQVVVNGSSPNLTLSYFFAPNGSLTNLNAGGSITFPATNLGSSATATVTVLNSGGLSGSLQSVTLSGASYQLANAPSAAVAVPPGQQVSFNVNFAPQNTGGSVGVLVLNLNGITTTIIVSGTGAATTGSQLTYSYSSGMGATTLLPGGGINMADVAVGQSTSVTISVFNAGTGATTISSIGLNAGGTVFTLGNLPSLPLNLNPGGTATFAVSFSPNDAGTIAETLHVDPDTFTVSGTGLPPPVLPGYQFQGPSGVQQPAQQPAVGLSLSSSYPLPLQGVLTLTFVSSVFTNDPAIQFASGGRTVAFTIPANSTQALFNGSATSIPLQTGTTAGNIVITPSFALQNGYSLTPFSPPALTMTIPAAAPQLVSGSIASETLSTFSLVLSGYATSRSLQKLDVQITPKQGQNFTATNLTIDVASGASNWFQSAASSSFGGAFQATIPFVLANGSTTDDLVHLLHSLSITATNEVGDSSALSVPIP